MQRTSSRQQTRSLRLIVVLNLINLRIAVDRCDLFPAFLLIAGITHIVNLRCTWCTTFPAWPHFKHNLADQPRIIKVFNVWCDSGQTLRGSNPNPLAIRFSFRLQQFFSSFNGPVEVAQSVPYSIKQLSCFVRLDRAL